MEFHPTQANGWFPKVSPDGTYVGYGSWTVYIANLSTLVETLCSTKGMPAGWISTDEFVWSEKVSALPPGSSDDETRLLKQIDAGTGVSSTLVADPTYVSGNIVLANAGHWASWLSSTNRVAYDNAFMLTAYSVHQQGEWFVTARPSDWHLLVYHQGVFVREIDPGAEAMNSRISSQGDVAYSVGGSVYVSLADETLIDATMSGYDRGETSAVLMYVGATLWLWTVAWSDSYGCQVFGRPVAASPTTAVVVEGYDLDYLDVVATATDFVLAGCSNVGYLTVTSVSLSAAEQAIGQSITPGSAGNTYPPLPHPITDVRTGLVSRPWSVWFQRQNESLLTLDSEVTGHLSRAQLQPQPSGTLLGRGTASSGTPQPILVGTGLTMHETTLSASASLGVIDDGDTGAACEVDWADGPTHRVIATDNTIFTFLNEQDGIACRLIVETGLGGFAPTWPATVRWTGAAPSFSAGPNLVDVFTFIWHDTLGLYYGSADQGYAAV